MANFRSHIKRYFILPLAFLLCLLSAGIVQAQCTNWSVSASPVESLCSGSGKITVNVTGTDAVNITGRQYSLIPLSGGGPSVPASSSNVFENLPAGTYRAKVEGTCGGSLVSKTVDVTVPGTYITFLGSAIMRRRPLPTCNTGQITVTLQNGRKPYKINITSAPAGYGGPTLFNTTNGTYILNDLAPGNYTVSTADSCGTSYTYSISMAALPALNNGEFFYYGAQKITGTCNTYQVIGPSVLASSLYAPYTSDQQAFTWSVAYNGGTVMPFKPLNGFSTNIDTLVLPAGNTLKDSYNKKYTVYVRDTCGHETSKEFTFPVPNLSYSVSPNCNTDFSLKYSIDGNYCLPVYMVFRKTSDNSLWYDTLTAGKDGTIDNVPFATTGQQYQLQMTTADGYTSSSNLFVTPPSANPYYAYLDIPLSGAPNGNDGAISFRISAQSGLRIPVGARIDLISPSIYSYTYTMTTSETNTAIFSSQGTPANKYFRPGDYLFRVTDNCGVYDIPITVTENDVYKYNFTYTQEATCGGLKIIPTGTITYQGAGRAAYFKIMSGPAGYNTAVVPVNTPIILPVPGTYRIGMSQNASYVEDYSINGGNGANMRTIVYTYTPPSVDVSRTQGWVCPGAPANSGTIAATAINGISPNGTYIYKLAAAGNGAAGPYMASNTTGRFSTATSGGAYTLVSGQNYDIRVEDECGAAAVQTVKILDLGSGSYASVDKSLYCVGDPVQFQVQDLPVPVASYEWSGPSNYVSYQRNPIISKLTPNREGMYIVKIKTVDICVTEIRDTVEVSLAPYRQSCYSAVTDTSVNPYAVGLLGNWRPVRSYVYYGARNESDPADATNIRKDGAYKDFTTFWKLQQQKWKAQQDTTRWIWNAESVLFNKKGFELENKDPLGRYNSAVYGYDDAIPVAVAQNSRYREVAYEGFEDYGFTNTQCDMSCPTARRFDFTSYSNRIDSTEHHSGRYSVRIQPNDTVVVVSPVTDTALTMIDPAFAVGSNACVDAQVLKKVNAGKSVLLPAFSPLAGKKVLFSAWVKEAQDCKCQSYTSNRVDLIVQKPGGNVVIQAHPKGSIIDGWQRYEQVVDLPAGATGLSMVLLATGSVNVYFDDIRIHPFNANMKSYVYDATTLRLMAELDENNYTTFYEYDDDGSLTRVKKETERGVKTIQESRSALIKEDVE